MWLYVHINIQPTYKPQLFVRISVQVAIVNSSYQTKDHEDVHVSGFAPEHEILQGFGCRYKPYNNGRKFMGNWGDFTLLMGFFWTYNPSLNWKGPTCDPKRIRIHRQGATKPKVHYDPWT